MEAAASTSTSSSLDVWNSFIAFTGVAAPAASIILYMAPLPTVRAFSKRNELLGDLPLLPYSSMLCNSFLWVTYGILKSQTNLMWASGIGLVLSIYYCASFAKASPKGTVGLPGTLAQHIQGFAAVAAFVSINAKQRKADPIGQLGVFINFAMYSSPLAAMKVVIDKKNSAAMPWPITLGSLSCCIFWALTAFFDAKDPYVYVPTMAGAFFAFLQVALKIVYPEQPSGATASSKLSPHLNSREVKLLSKKRR